MMHTPPHPGQLVRQVIEDFAITVTKASELLGVSRQQLTRLIGEQSSVSPEMALRLEAVFGSTADTWLAMQRAWDLAQVRKRADSIVAGLKRLDAA
ncbi:MAG: HigA family addiction module antitoxin [Wenzhouxiangellaceae bacterium]